MVICFFHLGYQFSSFMINPDTVQNCPVSLPNETPHFKIVNV